VKAFISLSLFGTGNFVQSLRRIFLVCTFRVTFPFLVFGKVCHEWRPWVHTPRCGCFAVFGCDPASRHFVSWSRTTALLALFSAPVAVHRSLSRGASGVLVPVIVRRYLLVFSAFELSFSANCRFSLFLQHSSLSFFLVYFWVQQSNSELGLFTPMFVVFLVVLLSSFWILVRFSSHLEVLC
jgi:hypothetical protein